MHISGIEANQVGDFVATVFKVQRGTDDARPDRCRRITIYGSGAEVFHVAYNCHRNLVTNGAAAESHFWLDGEELPSDQVINGITLALLVTEMEDQLSTGDH